MTEIEGAVADQVARNQSYHAKGRSKLKTLQKTSVRVSSELYHRMCFIHVGGNMDVQLYCRIKKIIVKDASLVNPVTSHSLDL